jgi:predicted transposase/invertase (TIGR01784 family)
LFTKQLESGNKYGKLRKTISIVITDFVMFKEEAGYHNRFHMRNDKSGGLFSDILEINTLELPKLSETSDGTELWDFMRFLNSETEEEMEAVAEKNPQIQKAVATVRKLSADEEARMYAEMREQALWDVKNRLFCAIEEGEKRGREEGIGIGERRGLEQAKKAFRALSEGKSAEEAAQISGLGVDEIKSLLT